MADMWAFRDAVSGWAAGGPGEPASELAVRLGLRTAVLLEGPSDLAAVEGLAARRGRDLAAEGVCVVPMGGAMSVGRYAALLGPPGLGLRLRGLCDEGEQRFYDRGLARAGAPPGGFFVCVADLEDELIRALGTGRVEEVIEAEGDLRAWQTFLHQPAQQGRPPAAAVAALPRHEEGPQDPLRQSPGGGPRPGTGTRPARRPPRERVTEARDAVGATSAAPHGKVTWTSLSTPTAAEEPPRHASSRRSRCRMFCWSVRSWLGLVSNHASRISPSVAVDVSRRLRARTFASFQRRAPRAV